MSGGLLGELIEFNQYEYYRDRVNGLIEPVLAMQEAGLLVDRTRLTQVRDRLDLERQLLQLQLNHKVGFDCNVRSPTDMRYLISDVLKISGLVKQTKKGKPSTDKETLLTLAYGSPHAEIFSTILEVRKRRTLLSGFLGMEVGPDGRYRARYKIHGTDSGRLSSQSPGGFEGGKGPQLQNIPKFARQLFVAPPGKTFAAADLRRAEAMFVAFDSGDAGLIEVFKDETRDLYAEFASDSLGKSIKKGDVEREVFKTVTHGANYGMGPGMLIKVLRIRGINIEDIHIPGCFTNMQKAEFLIEAYHRRYPAIRQVWHKKIRENLYRNRVLYDGFGRRRFFMGRLYGKDAANTERIAFSYPPQATIVEITNQAIRRLHAEGWMVVLQVHDSVMVECRDDEVNRCCEAIDRALIHRFELLGGTLEIPRDISVGKSWGSLEPWKP